MTEPPRIGRCEHALIDKLTRACLICRAPALVVLRWYATHRNVRLILPRSL